MASNGSEITWRPAIAELVATFLFVFVGAGTWVASGGNLLAIAFAHGLAMALLVASTAHLSGGHINPAVTFAAMVTRKMTVMQGTQFITFQLIGAILGALVLALVLPGIPISDGAGTLGDHGLGSGVAVWQGLLIEIVLTALLVLAVFGTTMDSKGPGAIAPLAIGLAHLVGHLIAGSWSAAWPLLYIVGPLLGAAIAALFYTRVLQQDDG